MNLFLEKRRKRSNAGKKGNQVRWKIAPRSHCDHNAIASKGKERKENKNLFFEEIDDDLLKTENPPNDGVERNWIGLRRELDTFKIPIKESNEIILLSNYGEIGHSVWPAIREVRDSMERVGKYRIHLPGSFILSRIR